MTQLPFDAPSQPADRELYTPSQLNREARMLLEKGLPSLWLTGEISNLSRPSSGHWYFSLKDAGAQLRCAMFRQRNLLARFKPQDGMHVIARGRISLYEPRGDYQFIVEHIEEAGEGALRRQFELLKAKLAAAGLFAPERKRPLPPLPRRIGIVTSPTGAAIRDVLHILRRRFPLIPVRVYPVPVQGSGAAEQIAAAIALASRRRDCDVLILARGGGSLEDLWSFNEEIVARAMAESAIPIVTGIGHEVDFTIADFVADVRAPTPSGAAELVVPDSGEWSRRLQHMQQRLAFRMQRRLADVREQLLWTARRLQQLHPGVQVRQQTQRTDELDQRLRRAMRQYLAQLRAQINQHGAQLQRCSPAMRVSVLAGRAKTAEARLTMSMQQRLERTRARFESTARTLNAVSPLGTLQRGYAIVSDAQGSTIVDVARIASGDLIETRLANGRIGARVEWTRGEKS